MVSGGNTHSSILSPPAASLASFLALFALSSRWRLAMRAYRHTERRFSFWSVSATGTSITPGVWPLSFRYCISRRLAYSPLCLPFIRIWFVSWGSDRVICIPTIRWRHMGHIFVHPSFFAAIGRFSFVRFSTLHAGTSFDSPPLSPCSFGLRVV